MALDDTSIPDTSVDVNGVVKLMQEQDASKAPGPDGMPAHFLKLLNPKLTSILTFIFQA